MATEVLKKSEYADLVRCLLKKRYLRKDEDGKIVETREEMFWRGADSIAEVEIAYRASDAEVMEASDEFFWLMAGGKFLPSSPTLMNAGRENGLLSACFVIPIPDSIDGIFTGVVCTARIQVAVGGTGFCFDQLRPTGDIVRSSGGRTSGPIAFMKVYGQVTGKFYGPNGEFLGDATGTTHGVRIKAE